MNEKEALTRVKIGDFSNGYGFDIQLLVNTVGVIGEMFKNGQISEIVQCKDCRYHNSEPDTYGDYCDKIHWSKGPNWFCGDGRRR